MDTFWMIFWPVFWVMIFLGLGFTFYYLIRILRGVFIVMKTAESVSEQIQSIADLIDDMKLKAKMGVFVDVLEMSKRLFFNFKKDDKKSNKKS